MNIKRIKLAQHNNSSAYYDAYRDLIAELSKNVLYIEFTKVNGDWREMYCTRSSEYIDEFYENEIINNDTSDHQLRLLDDMKKRLVRVYDIQKNEFRTIKFDSIEYIE